MVPKISRSEVQATMKQGTMNGKKNTNSLDTNLDDNDSTTDQPVDRTKTAPTNGSAKVIETKTRVYNEKVTSKNTSAGDDDDDDDDYIDPLNFLNDFEGDNPYPLTMTVMRNRNDQGVILPREQQECVGQFDVDPPNWRRDLRQLVPDGGYFMVVFRWNTTGPGGQPRGSIAAKEPVHFTKLVIPAPAAPPTGNPQQDYNAIKMQILAEMKMYKDLFGGGGNGNLNETITLLNTLGLIRKPGEDGGQKSLAEQIGEMKEVVSMIGGGTSGYDLIRDIANSEVVAETVAMVPDLVKAIINKKDQPTEPAERPKHDADAEPLPEHELTEAIDISASAEPEDRVEMPPAQLELYQKMIGRAIEDLLTNSPVDPTAMLCEQYFGKYPVDSAELITRFIAGEDAAIQFLASQTTDEILQKKILSLPHGKEWIKRLREKLLPA